MNGTTTRGDSLPRIGLSACFFHADPLRPIFKGKTLLYYEASMAEWVMRHGALPVLMPQAHGRVEAEHMVDVIDGLLLQGGSDVSPTSYGEAPQRPEWQGDAIRDAYEIELIRLCMRRRKPVFGVCRGLQVINVALGGTLVQDIETQLPEAQVHRDWEVYDQLHHDIRFAADGWLAKLYRTRTGGRVNSVHHQSIGKLGEGLQVEAWSEPDEIPEAIRYTRADTRPPPYVVGVQWHPEFHGPAAESLLAAEPLFDDFLTAVRTERGDV